MKEDAGLDKVIIYGAGASGRVVYDYLRYVGLQDKVHCFCDKNARSMTLPTRYASDGMSVLTFEETTDIDCPYVIAVITDQYHDEIAKMLEAHGKRYYNDVFEWLTEQGMDAIREFYDADGSACAPEKVCAEYIERSLYFVKRRLDPKHIMSRRERIKVRIPHVFSPVFNSIQSLAEYMAGEGCDVELIVDGADAETAAQAKSTGLRYVTADAYDIADDRPDIMIFNFAHAPAPYIAVGGYEKINENCGYVAVLPYSTVMMDNGEGGNTVTYRKVLSPLRYDSLIVSKPLYKHMADNYHDVVCMPNPKFDQIYRKLVNAEIGSEAKHEKLKDRRGVLWASDHHMTRHEGMGINNCIDRYFSDICRYFEDHRNMALIFRPFVVLIQELLEHNVWSEDDCKSIRRYFDDSPNMIWDDSPDYSWAYAASDAILTDSGSGIIYSYLPTKMPIMLLFRNRYVDCDYNKELTKHYYKAYEWSDVKDFIEMVARSEDPLYDARMRTVEEFIPDFDGRCGERIGRYIIDDYLKNAAIGDRPTGQLSHHPNRALTSSISASSYTSSRSGCHMIAVRRGEVQATASIAPSSATAVTRSGGAASNADIVW